MRSNYLFLSNGTGSQGAVRRVAGGIIITVLVTDTALQRLCHYKGYNNLDFRSWVLEIIDGSVLVSAANN